MSMETTMTVKSEGSQPARRIMDEEPEKPRNNKPVKRRRRHDAATVPPSDKVEEVGGEQQPSTTVSTSTVKRSSKFRGVSKHRWTGRFEAHLWDKGSWNPTQRKKGKQVYLGAYDEEESAARAYDLAAIKYWGPATFTNFPATDYEQEIEMMQSITKEEYLASLRRRSNGFSRGVSKYRGVAKHHHNGRWEARIGRVFGNKYLYLGTYSTQEEAAHAYDIAAIEYRGVNAVTNFDLSTYIRWLRPGVGGGLKSLTTSQDPRSNMAEPKPEHASSSSITQDQNKQSDFTFRTKLPLPKKVDDENNSKQAFLQRTVSMSSSCNSSSSPTALGLLLRSSIFRDLVEKNSSAANEEELDDESMKNKQVYIGSGDRSGAVFADEARYVFNSNAEALPLGLQDGGSSPLYNQSNGTVVPVE